MFLSRQLLARMGAQLGGPIDPEHLVGTTTTLKIGPHWDARYHLGGRVLDLGREATLSLSRHRVELLRQALRHEGLYDRQRRLPSPPDVTRVVVIHPVGAAGHADVAGELSRWAQAGLMVVRCHASAFEGEAAPRAIAAALRDAVMPLAGSIPDVVLMVRGGGARSGLETLDHEVIARAIALCPVPVIAGLGHAIDRALVDEIVWRSCDTPSKAVTLVAAIIRAPATRMRQHGTAIANLAREQVDFAALDLATCHADVGILGQRALSLADTTLAATATDLRVVAASTRARCCALAIEAQTLLAGIAANATARLTAATQASADQHAIVTGAVSHRLATADDGARACAGVVQAAAACVDRAAMTLAHLHDANATAVRTVLDSASDALVATEAIVSASSLETQLARGFVVVTDRNGTMLNTVAALHGADTITLLVADGDVDATVQHH
ncbi:exodeoxyribonuclease VII large subunit [Lichenihabitans sp. Uapishka_5]|uniref:exodeoxyribonuclease VII large subunit n=1 Tax=Lichenihabitans sp. Uapishka_5 TaxID=3037302 RepID=UPI0029E7FC8E|nr:exodeoxyribonuclease VII large subunit [Lichenihabitans sp. Uapishka_5]MDX7953469.1 exodeoxyribonuclease VII large subunit [Lichenihabitans sp. Uapishka_5]